MILLKIGWQNSYVNLRMSVKDDVFRSSRLFPQQTSIHAVDTACMTTPFFNPVGTGFRLCWAQF